jgi:hypothetical protein
MEERRGIRRSEDQPGLWREVGTWLLRVLDERKGSSDRAVETKGVITFGHTNDGHHKEGDDVGGFILNQ